MPGQRKMDYVLAIITIYTYLANHKLYLLIFSFLMDLNSFNNAS